MKKAYTLIEILISLSIIAVIIAVIASNLKLINYKKTGYVANIHKIIESIQVSSEQIRADETVQVPTGHFITSVLGTPEITVYPSSGSGSITSQNVVDLYGKYLTYLESGINFCNYTAYCSNENIKGAKLPGGIYIGFEVSDSLIDCPSYVDPETKNTIAISSRKCWAKLYVNLDNKHDNNTLGDNIYIFGLDKDGIAI